ncbi:hypothetical protein CRG98_024525 [Punica granatum]|uniref:Uncharacterized protein n=1 Tax=Punica granatum TaxID=22663 RepID=A0A2I0JFM6_PUNGR|nr:hypothetical protein CRG98_024525 [Punica granatum]
MGHVNLNHPALNNLPQAGLSSLPDSGLNYLEVGYFFHTRTRGINYYESASTSGLKLHRHALVRRLPLRLELFFLLSFSVTPLRRSHLQLLHSDSSPSLSLATLLQALFAGLSLLSVARLSSPTLLEALSR